MNSFYIKSEVSASLRRGVNEDEVRDSRGLLLIFENYILLLNKSLRKIIRMQKVD